MIMTDPSMFSTSPNSVTRTFLLEDFFPQKKDGNSEDEVDLGRFLRELPGVIREQQSSDASDDLIMALFK